ncbi:hypothetical protein PI125_g20162 [Phytophthora idaei]|nr:hypothetical protein PI125_g20162 [Phytophthora idaei]
MYSTKYSVCEFRACPRRSDINQTCQRDFEAWRRGAVFRWARRTTIRRGSRPVEDTQQELPGRPTAKHDVSRGQDNCE